MFTTRPEILGTFGVCIPEEFGGWGLSKLEM